MSTETILARDAEVTAPTEGFACATTASKPLSRGLQRLATSSPREAQVQRDLLRGRHEARPISGPRGIEIVQRFEAEINLAKIRGVHGKNGDDRAARSWDSEAWLTFRSIGLSWSTSGFL